MKRADHHEVKVLYDGEPEAMSSGPTPCLEMFRGLATEILAGKTAASCRHHKMWIIAGGYWYWCWECGAVRQAKRDPASISSHPVGPWIKPVGKGGKNPSEKLQ